jgi:predicted DNA-binding transcriptional regulator YafY
MPANKYALLRYRIIDKCLSNKARPFPSKDELREACEEALYGSIGEHISASTIEKDLWAMRNESELGYYAPIEFSKVDKGYFYDQEDYSIQNISLSDNDLNAIKLAAHTLNQFREIEIFADYNSAIDKIMNRLAVHPDQGQNKRVTIQFESAPGTAGQNYLNGLISAIDHKSEVTFNYQKFGENGIKQYNVHPYLLREYRNRWYLIAFEPKRNEFLTFGLDRMSNLNEGERFEFDSTFDPDQFFKYSIGITQRDSIPKKVILKTSTKQGQYLESQPLHHSQKIKYQEDGCLVELEVLLTYELIHFVLSCGKEVEVISPKKLRQIIIDEIQQLSQLYSTT